MADSHIVVQTLELVMMCKEAHDKQRIHCLAAGKDGFLYSGGEDKVGCHLVACSALAVP